MNKYLEAQCRKIHVGIRFMMTFEDEHFAESRLLKNEPLSNVG
ncbi:hypothetical protein Hdeb2414_s0003g00102291 [Helianthus debilis subsp. tardiflorus]